MRITSLAAIQYCDGSHLPWRVARPRTGIERTGGGREEHVHNGVYYFSGMGANSSYPREDQVTIRSVRETRGTRNGRVKKSIERAGCTMERSCKYRCSPACRMLRKCLADWSSEVGCVHGAVSGVQQGVSRFFGSGKTPSRAFMSVDWFLAIRSLRS